MLVLVELCWWCE